MSSVTARSSDTCTTYDVRNRGRLGKVSSGFKVMGKLCMRAPKFPMFSQHARLRSVCLISGEVTAAKGNGAWDAELSSYILHISFHSHVLFSTCNPSAGRVFFSLHGEEILQNRVQQNQEKSEFSAQVELKFYIYTTWEVSGSSCNMRGAQAAGTVKDSDWEKCSAWRARVHAHQLDMRVHKHARSSCRSASSTHAQATQLTCRRQVQKRAHCMYAHRTLHIARRTLRAGTQTRLFALELAAETTA